jgi:hypothetical protein
MNVVRQPIDAADALNCLLVGRTLSLRRPQRVKNVPVARADRSPSAKGEPRFDALANDNLAAGWSRVLRTVMNRLGVG